MIFQNPYNRNLQTLAGFTDFLSAAAGALGAGGATDSGGGALAPSNQVTVNPNINVNPQISPIFQQQFQPTNSPISAGTSQGTPQGSNSSGAGGGGGFAAPSVPQVPSIPIEWNKYILYGAIGIGALFAIKLLAGKKTAVKRYRRRSVRKVK